MTRIFDYLKVPALWAAPALMIAFLSLGVGALSYSPSEIFWGLVNKDSGEIVSQIIWEVRLPRILSALLAGGVLALSGATLQGVFHNPLVDPHIIGVSSGAAFGGTLAITLGFSGVAMMSITFAFGLASLILLFLVARAAGKDDRLMLVLAGILLAGFFSALVSLLQYLADTEETLPSIVFWLMGSFATARWDKFFLFVIPALIGTLVLIRLRWRINLLTLDDRDAATLGIKVTPLRWAVLTLCALLVSSQVAVSGSIGWVGLLIPHLVRPFVGADHRKLLPAAFWAGAGYLILVDDVARTLTSAEIPLGILTAIIGAPLFAFLLFKHKSEVL